ncbi:hypothetical protein K458DRAFT_26741 [Lentithecium fluviatile CBS 122367]|uniref:Uncharacterized protein n=1 Tax=Lentithecium fluviatile CBS 122367 TaxID=1168545 RepID=A0A6G1J3J5_9PLEO|nr:hypothetical protein K458DRAFT_26741 [Lentithecium fluviatile CBS 122367]
MGHFVGMVFGGKSYVCCGQNGRRVQTPVRSKGGITGHLDLIMVAFFILFDVISFISWIPNVLSPMPSRPIKPTSPEPSATTTSPAKLLRCKCVRNEYQCQAIPSNHYHVNVCVFLQCATLRSSLESVDMGRRYRCK